MITMQLSWWMVPTAITLFWIVVIVVVANRDSKPINRGFTSINILDLYYTVVTTILGLGISLISWVTYAVLK